MSLYLALYLMVGVIFAAGFLLMTFIEQTPTPVERRAIDLFIAVLILWFYPLVGIAFYFDWLDHKTFISRIEKA